MAADSANLSEVDISYFHAMERGLADLKSQHANSSMIKNNQNTLNSTVDDAIQTNKHTTAILLLALNIQRLKSSIDSPAVISHFSYLLNQEVYPLANELLHLAESVNDAYVVSRMHFQLAQYFYHRGQYTLAQKHLTAIEARNALTAAQSDYATIIFGVTLQHQKNHRGALKYYETIKPKSPYFGYAQLNKAVVYIRQGWWTDAKLAIDSALGQQPSSNTEEFTNRLHLVLGYNQVQHEFYRNARESFRNITLESQYADRALLGIGLCALNQGDYVGAINAFGILKSKNKTNISVAESYLLYAFTHEQMSQPSIASAMYEEAIAYFNKRIRETDAVLVQLQTQLPADNLTAPLSENTQVLPDFYKARKRNLQYLTSEAKATATKTVLAKALEEQRKETHKLAMQAFLKEKDILVSYLSQAQFGQAKLFDNIQ